MVDTRQWVVEQATAMLRWFLRLLTHWQTHEAFLTLVRTLIGRRRHRRSESYDLRSIRVAAW
ncbi:hypothetical protein GCM10009608_09940 [Pseudonocardia alaniniphila]